MKKPPRAKLHEVAKVQGGMHYVHQSAGMRGAPPTRHKWYGFDQVSR